MYARDAVVQLLNCDFLGNQASVAGGAVDAVGASDVTLGGCLLAGNGAVAGGAALNAALGAKLAVNACTLADGGAGTGAVAGWDAGELAVDATIVAFNAGSAWLGDAASIPLFGCSDLYGNGADWAGALADQAGVRDNLAADPLFCSANAPDDPYGLDESSACAAAGPCGLIGARSTACSTVGIITPPGNPVVPGLPGVTELLGNRPNPFNPTTTVSFAVRRDAAVRITVYDVAGRVVKRLTDQVWAAGVHDVTWYGDDAFGRQAATGVYFVRMDADGVFDTIRVALVK